MTEVGNRLAQCFQTVLPYTPAEEISKINVRELAEANSWATATLGAVIEEEFSIKADLDLLWELGTFEAIERYLAERLPQN